MFDSVSLDNSRTSVTIDLNALEENYRSICTILSAEVTVLCIIKADAYGHGAVEVGRRLEAAGARYFGVATLEEGRELRENGISNPILVVGGIMPWEQLEPFSSLGLNLVVSSGEMLDKIEGYKGRKRLKVHVKIDTGMGRLGFGPGELNDLAKRLKKMAHVEVEGVMSHFASSERRDDYGFRQIESFENAVGFLRRKGIVPRYLHMANSGAICNYPEAHYNMVRPGIMLYGSFPDKSLCHRIKLKPVMRLASRISFLRLFPEKQPLSYGRTFVTERETRIGYIPLGYADGYSRALSNRATVLIKGRRCRVVGRICMDWLLVDVTEVPAVEAGEEVVLLGRAAGGETITADELAEQAGTIPYEVLCGISNRVPRRYV